MTIRETIDALEALAVEHGYDACPVLDLDGGPVGFVADWDESDSDNGYLTVSHGTDCGR
jgi:CBS domain-containing protein